MEHNVQFVTKTAEEIINAAGWSWFSSHHVDGKALGNRIVCPLRSKESPLKYITIGTHKNARKIAEIKKDPHCTLMFTEHSNEKTPWPTSFVSVYCEATVDHEPRTKKEDHSYPWVKDEDFAVIHCTPYRVEVLSGCRGVWETICMKKSNETGEWSKVPLEYPAHLPTHPASHKSEFVKGEGKQPPTRDDVVLPPKKGNKKEYTAEELRNVALDVMIKARIANMATKGQDGKINCRLMDTVAGFYENEKTVFYIAAYKESRKVANLKSTPLATFGWATAHETGERRHAPPTGYATMIAECSFVDEETKKKYYSSDWDPFLTNGANSENYELMRFEAKEIEIYHPQWDVGCLVNSPLDPCILTKDAQGKWIAK